MLYDVFLGVVLGVLTPLVVYGFVLALIFLIDRVWMTPDEPAERRVWKIYLRISAVVFAVALMGALVAGLATGSLISEPSMVAAFATAIGSIGVYVWLQEKYNPRPSLEGCGD